MAILFHAESESYLVRPHDFNPDRCMDAALCVPVAAHKLPAYTPIGVGFGQSTTLPDMDFETYSEAGYWWDPEGNKGLGRWRLLVKGKKSGIECVGAAAYSEHPTCEVLSLAYNLKDGKGERLWLPCMPPPQELFDHIARGGLIEAHNSGFEWLVWVNVCMKKMGWPPLPLKQLRCSASKCRAWSLPGALGAAARALELDQQKDIDGMRLLRKFSCPRSPTKADPRQRIDPLTDPVDGPKLYSYNVQDIVTESDLSAHVPDLTDRELALWMLDQRINMRGAQVDMDSVEACIKLFEPIRGRLNAELRDVTGGRVPEASKDKAFKEWLEVNGASIPNMQADTIEEWLADKGPALSPIVRRALEIRSVISSASVKKLYALQRQTSYDGRLRELFKFCGADRTGRFSGQGAQPQNFPSTGPEIYECATCGRHYGLILNSCPSCRAPRIEATRKVEWNPNAVEDALYDIKFAAVHGLDWAEGVWGNVVEIISSCLRGLFIAAPGHDLICSDYSAIEAVVLAMLAREEWRIEVFRTHGKIYEMSAAKTSGIPIEEILRHKEETGSHHPLRKKLGKVGELAGGYQGGLGAWKNFGAGEYMTDEEIKENVKKWRAESPNIVNFWYAMEGCAVNAVKFPGNTYQHNGIAWCMRDDVLYCRLLSGRLLAYHKPRLRLDTTPWGKTVDKLSYLGTEQGKLVRIDTYGGKLTENIVQATARDILTNAMPALEAAGYPIVLHVHDEIVSEVPKGFGSIEEFEAIMARMPTWAADWPIKAAGGWRGLRYRKD